ncbi:MAG: ATP-binding protein [Eggerthellaceae bacterium]|nr:ATP-binding protein [Eggerthellaceae bacterium]
MVLGIAVRNGLPLSLSEYLDFCGLSFSPGSSVALAPDGSPVLFDDVMARYLRYGGMPAIASLETDQATHAAYMRSVYEAIAVRDIINRERRSGESRVTDPSLLRRIAEFLADNVGNLSSASSIANTLTSAGAKTTNKTVSSYLDALCDAFMFYRAARYDLHGKEILKTNPKHYIVDLGFRSHLAGYRVSDVGRLFENAVYLQLRYGGYEVHVGKLYGREVDFVAVKDDEVLYVQAADNIASESTRERELAPLRAIRDAHPKMVVVREGAYESDADGIRIVRARDFFL